MHPFIELTQLPMHSTMSFDRAWFFAGFATGVEYHRRFLQQTARRRNARRWVLKAPTHMFTLATLLAVLP